MSASEVFISDGFTVLKAHHSRGIPDGYQLSFIIHFDFGKRHCNLELCSSFLMELNLKNGRATPNYGYLFLKSYFLTKIVINESLSNCKGRV